jgi:hypothetical protein
VTGCTFTMSAVFYSITELEIYYYYYLYKILIAPSLYKEKEWNAWQPWSPNNGEEMSARPLAGAGSVWEVLLVSTIQGRGLKIIHVPAAVS